MRCPMFRRLGVRAPCPILDNVSSGDFSGNGGKMVRGPIPPPRLSENLSALYRYRFAWSMHSMRDMPCARRVAMAEAKVLPVP